MYRKCAWVRTSIERQGQKLIPECSAPTASFLLQQLNTALHLVLSRHEEQDVPRDLCTMNIHDRFHRSVDEAGAWFLH